MKSIVYKLYLSKSDRKSKNVHNLYKKNYKILLKNKKGDLNKCIGHSPLKKVSILPQLICKFTVLLNSQRNRKVSEHLD